MDWPKTFTGEVKHKPGSARRRHANRRKRGDTSVKYGSTRYLSGGKKRGCKSRKSKNTGRK